MRRAPLVLSATAAGLAGLLAFHSHRPASKVAVVAPASTPPATTPPAGPASPATTSPTPSTSPTSPTPSTSPTTSNASGTRRATGQVEGYRYGELSVTVTETNGRITDAEMASLNETDSRSVQIDDDAIPQLRQEVLDAQSANIDGVSGATFTSQAYAASVQSALDQLGSG
jgi:uncharacterized protein with FMN-binding domain